MEKKYDLEGYKVMVIIEPKLIRIMGSSELLEFLSKDLNKHTYKLVKVIKSDYLRTFKKPLKITIKSLMVEIWGHLYASKFADILKEMIQLQLVENLSNSIKERSDTIDCGEADVDSNRKFWDILSKFTPLIIKFLPKPNTGH